MIDLEERLTRHLRGEADAMVVPAVGARAVVERARRRFARRRAVAALVTVGVVTTSVVAVVHRPTPKDRIEVKVTGSSTPDASGPAVLVPSKLHWQTVADARGLLGARVHRHSGALYAVATAPGQAPVGEQPKTMGYTSADGITWTPHDFGDRWIADLDGSGSRVYAVGTAAATAPIDPKTHVGDAVVLRSDGGAWQTTVLPLDLRSLATKARTLAGRSMVGVSEASVAAGPAGVLVAFNVVADIDLMAILPSGTTLTGPVVYKAAGVELHDAGRTAAAGESSSPSTTEGFGPVVATYTYAQLGIDAGLAAAMQGELRFFFSADGITFIPVDVPHPVDAQYLRATVMATDAGYLTTIQSAGVSGRETFSVYESTDGQAWTKVDLPGGYPQAIGQLGGQLALVGEGPSLVRVGSGGPVTIDLRAISRQAMGTGAYVSSAAIGPTGVAFVGVPMVTPTDSGALEPATTSVGPIGDPAVTVPRRGLTATTVEVVAVRDAVVEATSPTSATTVEVTDTGPVVATTAPIAQAQKLVLFESSDGVHWSATDIGQQVGTPITGASVVATDTSFVVTATLPGTRIDQPATQKVLVATR